tara:strand:- start:566 stop:1339 length:774 start_codon:yes stop_codon:yes gene_type:complete
MRIIAGPCQHESVTQSLEIARECKRVCDDLDIDYVFKASFDKANRTSLKGQRGKGLDVTLESFRTMKLEIAGLQTLTDVHDVTQVNTIKEIYNDAVDILQVPAFLCRQTDLIKACVQTGKIINIKKGQFLAPWDVKGILSKTVGAKRVWITERGTSFGYNTLVVDFTGMAYIMENYSADLIFDVTHSVQKPGGLNGSSGGNSSYVPGLARAGSALGVRSFFIEVHADPVAAPSDGPNMLKLCDFEKVASDIKKHGSI